MRREVNGPIFQVAILALSLTACTDDFERRPPDVHSHVESYYLPELTPPRIDLLFVIDDTTAMTLWQSKLRAFPAVVDAMLGTIYTGQPSVRIAVTTDGTLRRSSLVDGAFISDAGDFGGPHIVNYRGALHEALLSLMDVGATRQGPSRLFAAAEGALANDFARLDAYLAVVTIAAADDASPGGAGDYAASLKGTRDDPTSMIVSGIYTPGLPRLDELHTQFPNRSEVTPIGSMDWSEAFDLLAQVHKTTLGIACVQKPLDLDPETPGDQFDCAMEYFLDGRTQALPYCGKTLPCWELVDEPAACFEPEAHYAMKVHGFGDPYHPAISGQCVVK
ncbi:MAG: hypothetical protein HOV81_40530 [Kofleriaceae bacterium]|nr:hypothetical protein [Kofleriaceae bacterium]